jgi:DNA-binding CsgD family transcriptional regulator
MRTIGQRTVWYVRAELALAKGNPDLALQIIDQLLASINKLSSGQSVPRLSKVRGVALVALQRAGEAEAELRAAQEAAHRLGWRPFLWRISVALGKLYQTQARQEEAEQEFSIAQVLIEELTANIADEHLREHFLSQATAMLPKKHLPAPGRTAQKASAGLTTREREVARLVSQGKSNRAIAEELVVGISTVEAHITHIFNKLGFSSRAQIAAWAVDKGLTEVLQDVDGTKQKH